MSDRLTEYEQRRCEARLTAYNCYVVNRGSMQRAMPQFVRKWNDQEEAGSKHIIKDVRRFIQHSVDKLQQNFTLRTLRPHGANEKVPTEVIRECGEIIAQGYAHLCTITVDGITYQYREHRFFTSLKEAVTHSERLAQVLEQYNINTRYLRKKLRKYCPGLVYHALRMGQTLTKKQMQQRSEYAAEMLRRLRLNPRCLLDIHFMDECTIWIGKDLISNKLHVWSYKADTEGAPPVPNPIFVRSRSFKVNILLVVNGRTGHTYAEFLTGTAGLGPDGRHHAEMNQTVRQLPGQKYKVS